MAPAPPIFPRALWGVRLKALAPRVATFLALVGLGSGCCHEPETACLPWVREHHEYSLRLLDEYASKIPTGTLPHPGWNDLDHSCGGDFDLNPDQSLDANVVRVFSPGGKCATCQGAEIDVDVPEVSWLEKDEELDSNIDQFGESGRVEIAAGCTGRYAIAVFRVNEYFIDSASAPVLSDYMFHREFAPDDASACGLTVVPGDSCFDSWFVRILDPKGAQLSNDNPR